MGPEVQLPPTLSPAPSPPSHLLQPHSVPMVLLPFTPSHLPLLNPSSPPTSLLENLCTHLACPIPQHLCKCSPQCSPQNICRHPSLSCHLAATPLCASAAVVEDQEVAITSPSCHPLSHPAIPSPILLSPLPPGSTLLRKGSQPWGQPPLVAAGTGGREGFTAVPLLRLQM